MKRCGPPMTDRRLHRKLTRERRDTEALRLEDDMTDQNEDLQQMQNRQGIALDMVREELERATELFGAFPTSHHGFGAILEEALELMFAVFWGNGDDTEEATQLAAMAVRYLVDCTDTTHVGQDYDAEPRPAARTLKAEPRPAARTLKAEALDRAARALRQTATSGNLVGILTEEQGKELLDAAEGLVPWQLATQPEPSPTQDDLAQQQELEAEEAGEPEPQESWMTQKLRDPDFRAAFAKELAKERAEDSGLGRLTSLGMDELEAFLRQEDQDMGPGIQGGTRRAFLQATLRLHAQAFLDVCLETAWELFDSA